MISVAMTTYNGERYLTEQIDSVLRNLRDEDELWISDDGSIDSTPALLQEYAKKDVRIHLTEGPRQGIIANFEHAMTCCKGDVIFLADQDDVWSDHKVETVLSTMEKTGATLVMHDAEVRNGNMSEVLIPSFQEYRGCKTGVFQSFVKNRYIGCCMAFRRELLPLCLPIPRNIQMHDQWIGLIADWKKEKTLMIPDKLLLYRRHEATNSDFSRNSVPVMIKNRLVLLVELLKTIGRN